MTDYIIEDYSAQITSHYWREKKCYGASAMIKLYTNDHRFCFVLFFEPDLPLRLNSPNYVDREKRELWLSYHLSQFPAIVDMIRHEEPITIRVSEESGSVWLNTGKEPVGEEENT